MPFSLPLIHTASLPGCQRPFALWSLRIPPFHLLTMWGFWPQSLSTHLFYSSNFCVDGEACVLPYGTHGCGHSNFAPPPFFGGAFFWVFTAFNFASVRLVHASFFTYGFLGPLSPGYVCARDPYYNDYTLKSADFTLIHTILNLVIL